MVRIKSVITVNVLHLIAIYSFLALLTVSVLFLNQIHFIKHTYLRKIERHTKMKSTPIGRKVSTCLNMTHLQYMVKRTSI